MFITAHGGAHKTGRNSRLYFERIPEYKCDILEVDIRQKGGLLYLSHMPTLCPKKCLTLEYAFEKVREHGVYINCDMKQRGLLEDVLALARKTGVEDKILFTGNVIDEDEVKKLSGGRVFFNKLKGLAFKEGNAAAIKKRMLDERFAGINANKMFVSDAFLRECREEGVDVSLFTLNTEEDAKRYVGMKLYNLTCNNPACVRAVYEGLR